MKRAQILTACLLPIAAHAFEPAKTFDVASIKPSAGSGDAGGHSLHGPASGARLGPGTADATRWACDNCSLGLLIGEAYNLKRFQITGPKFLDTEHFDVAARVPEGATKDDLHLMLQNLLVERFGLKTHLDRKDMQVYDLVVGKGAPKLKEAGSAEQPGAAPAVKHEYNGASHDSSAGRAMSTTMTFHGTTRHQAVGEDMQQLANFLSSQLDKPVTDSTGLRGKYDFLLTFSADKPSESSGPMGQGMHGGPGGGYSHPDGADTDPMSQPPLQKAIQDQLGLRLEAKKGSAGILIVDHLEKSPSEN